MTPILLSAIILSIVSASYQQSSRCGFSGTCRKGYRCCDMVGGTCCPVSLTCCKKGGSYYCVPDKMNIPFMRAIPATITKEHDYA